MTSTAYPLKTAGGGGGGGILVDRGPPGVPHTNGHVLKGKFRVGHLLSYPE